MTRRPIMDAGPGVNFFSLHQERLLFRALGPIAVPETVQEEILRKARQEQRFAPAATVIGKLPTRLFEVVADEANDQDLVRAVDRLTGMPLVERRRRSKDLGETMVVAHASVAAMSGADVRVLIDDGGGQDLAVLEQHRLDVLRRNGRQVGRLIIVDTRTVLARAAELSLLEDRGAMRKLYERLRELDDGLVPIQDTGLLDLDCWKR